MIKIYFHKSLAKAAWEIFAFEKDNGDRTPIKITFERLKTVRIGEMAEPSCEIPSDDFMTIISALKYGLADAGLLQNEGYKQEIDAVRYHLEDMRTIALSEQRQKS